MQPTAGEAVLRTRPEEHAASWGSWLLHTALVVEAEMTGPAGFLTLLLPRASDEPAPEVALYRPADGVAAACVAGPAGLDVVVLQRGAGDAVVELAFCPGAVPQGALTVGPGLAVVHFDPEGNPLYFKHFDGGSIELP